MISFPMRIRHYLENHATLQTILKIVVDEIRKRLIACGPHVQGLQICAISFIQYFGNTLNYHPHFHLIVADGIFSGDDGQQFHEATLAQDDIKDKQDAIQSGMDDMDRRSKLCFPKAEVFVDDQIRNKLAHSNGFDFYCRTVHGEHR